MLTERKIQLGEDNWDINRNTFPPRKKNPNTQYWAIMHNLHALELHAYNAHIDNKVHRLHSVLTNMQKEFRNFITHSNDGLSDVGQELVAIDVKNCQPYLVCALLNKSFWNQEDKEKTPLNIYNTPINIQEQYLLEDTSRSISIMIGNYLSKLDKNEFDEYISLVADGKMYETIMRWVKEETSQNISRNDAKTTMFSMLFSSNKGQRNDGFDWLRKYYKKRFPAISELFSIIKGQYKGLEKKQHARLACLLQTIESEIILHRCCKRIWQEKAKEVSIYTIHDSIVTTKEHHDYVKKVMYEELKNAIGVAPSLESEEWNENNLDKEILKQIN